MKLATLLISLLLLGGAGVLIFYSTRDDPVSVEKLMRDARRARRKSDHAETLQIARTILESEPENSDAHMLAAHAAAWLRRPDEAIAHYRCVQSTCSDYAEAMWRLGDLLLYKRLARECETVYRAALKEDPTAERANSGLSVLLGIEGRRWESLPFLMRMVGPGMRSNLRSPNPIPNELFYVATLGNNVDVNEVPGLLAADPDYLVPRIGEARELIHKGRRTEAERILVNVLKSHPEQLEAHAHLGQLLVDRPAAFRKWLANLPDNSDSHPGIWMARGLGALESEQPEAAVRCFAEAVHLDAEHPRANYLLGNALARSGQAAAAEPFLERHRRLLLLTESVEKARSRQRDLKLLQSVAAQMENLGRIREAMVWSRMIVELFPQQTSAGRKFKELSRMIRKSPPTSGRSLMSAVPMSKFDRTTYPLPDWSGSIETSGNAVASTSCRTRFKDVSQTAGLDFSYFSSPDPTTPGHLMYEFAGGGIGVIDFDLDGRPDLYLTQGREWKSRTTEHHNCLYRSVGGRFEEVSITAGCADRGFGQGVSVGDYNSDGFPDVYVANIGANHLFLNQGDGTFRDVSSEIIDPAGRWTTSCLIADLDGDGHPDLYDVNYLSGSDLFERMCSHKGVVGMCGPVQYPGESDQAYRNLGEGSFARVTEKWNLAADNGKGLGIVAADLDESGTLEVFVANDMVPNFLFSNTASPGETADFQDLGLVNGLAVDRNGRHQACMGVAAGDVDGDKRLDLFVTNFFEDSNTLYLSEPDGTFSDRTQAKGLSGPGFNLLGFGAQFLDGDADGRLDLMLTNGHIEDYRAAGEPYRMSPHYYHQRTDGRFDLIASDQVGEFFSGKYLGRAMARLDWNGDGLEEVVIGHLDGPTNLLENETREPGRSLVLRLCGTTSCRDAVGTRVQVDAGTEQYVQQLTAGSGYQASNHRQLVFGLGRHDGSCDVEIKWPSGKIDKFSQLSGDQSYTIIEGRDRVFLLPR